MAEKKKSWFGRLFGGKKKDEPAQVEVVETASETEIPETLTHDEPKAIPVDSSAPGIPAKTAHEVTAQNAVEESVEHISEKVIEAVTEEVHESFIPEKPTKSEEAIHSQHHFIDEVAQEAKAEIEAGHAHLAETSTLPATAEEIHEADTVITKSHEEAEVNSKAQHPLIEEIAQDAKAEVIAGDTTHLAATDTPTEARIIETTALTEEPTTELISEPEVEVATEETLIETEVEAAKSSEVLQEKPQKKTGFFARLSNKLSKTRNSLTEGIADLFLGKKEINEEILEELETRLLMADVGINVTEQMLTSIRDSVSRKSLSNVDELFAALKVQMKDILEPVSKPLVIDTNHKPYVILMIGVNGVGKTTTIGKLAKKFQAEGKSVMLAAGDTFRAAAVEQLEIWGERNKIPVISQKEGADPASVIFDAMESAKSRKVDILIADTAGRLHTDSGLMQELAKINRVIKRHDETAPHEVMLVVDASTGQNALNQARQFNTTVPLSGITFTKLDGTAKGGIIFAIAEELNIPIRFIGVGESIDDLRPFDSSEFVDALISTDKTS